MCWSYTNNWHVDFGLKMLTIQRGNGSILYGRIKTRLWEWLPSPIFLPRESHGQRSLVGHRETNTSTIMPRVTWSPEREQLSNCGIQGFQSI